MNKLVKLLPFVFLIGFVLLTFKPFFIEKKLPIPADTIVGLYHPWRDLYSGQYPSGIPFRNFLITDPVRQQYPWRQLAISQVKKGQMPWWNPYSFSGTELLGNFQAAPFYPLNFLYWLFDFPTAWSFQIISQFLLGGLFMYLFLRNLKLKTEAILLGVVAWVGSGFFVAWAEWNTLVQTAIWLPLILLSVDKLFKKKTVLWSLIFLFSICSSLAAGHLQTFFYVFLVGFIYFFANLYKTKDYSKVGLLTLIFFLSAALTFFIWQPALSFINQSARSLDQTNWQAVGFFIPWQNLVQIVAPDFFGNPATLNYFGVWNYGEFISYIGIAPLIFALSAIFFRKDKKTLFFLIIAVISLLFALPTPIAKIPFLLNLPFISTSQPTRLILLIDFSGAVLAALGLDYFLKVKNKKTLLICLSVFVFLVAVAVFSKQANQVVSLRNLYLPLTLSGVIMFLTLLYFLGKKSSLFIWAIILLTSLELSRSLSKYESFSDYHYLFPQTKITEFLKQRVKDKPGRILALDDRILPPNFCVQYKFECVSGYDPLYLKTYGQLIAAIERSKPDISAPFGFNRIITPKNYQSYLFPYLKVKYLLSLSEIKNPDYHIVFEEGTTKVYEYSYNTPKAQFARKVYGSYSPIETINLMSDPAVWNWGDAVVESWNRPDKFYIQGEYNDATVVSYEPNQVDIKTSGLSEGFLILSDAYDRHWKATIDGKMTKIYLTNFTFRGIIVPQGKHTVRFFYNP